jgi:hypothetical protein
VGHNGFILLVSDVVQPSLENVRIGRDGHRRERTPAPEAASSKPVFRIPKVAKTTAMPVSIPMSLAAKGLGRDVRRKSSKSTSVPKKPEKSVSWLKKSDQERKSERSAGQDSTRTKEKFRDFAKKADKFSMVSLTLLSAIKEIIQKINFRTCSTNILTI